MVKRSKSTEKMTLANLNYLIYKNKCWLNPEYQRESVWTLSQKQLFVDSLLIGIDIPKLYFRAIDKDSYEYEVVDGQQRLRSISEFFNDDFRMPKDADDVEECPVRNCCFSELNIDLQMQLRDTNLDVVVLSAAYTDDDIEETFLRLQNGTPLNAPEKRRAVAGNMRNVVQELANHKIFSLCSFENKRFAHEDAAAKFLHLLLAGIVTDIKPLSIQRTYEQNKHITGDHPTVKRAYKAYRFIVKAFKTQPSPKLKKYAMITLPHLTLELLEKYNLSDFPTEFAKGYLSFEFSRAENGDLSEEKQDARLAAYTDAARSDSIQAMRYRHELLREAIVRKIPELTLKDTVRGFSDEQRLAIFWRDDGKCQSCGQECDENEFHADHITPHAKGGETKISNAQLLCPECNQKKGSKAPITGT